MKRIAGALFLAAFVLAGCSTVKEGPPAPDKLCTGTRRPYQVKGITYTPQHHYEYEEEGVASWYGPRFHGRPKSCGEIFDMHGISAAHKTLPIPSVVEVTNVKNGSRVNLLIDDRGPFVGDRIIDLSKGAATYLGIHNQGLGRVRVKCLPEASRAFASFVSRYGRYGRDPDGRTWEAIFREKFDEGCVPASQPLTYQRPLRHKNEERWSKLRTTKKTQPFQRPVMKPTPVSSQVESDEDIDREIEAMLDDTRKYLKRKQA